MKSNLYGRTAVLLLGTLCLAAGAVDDVTPQDRDYARHYLTQTRDALIEATKGLSEAQWKFKADPDCWSIAEVVEHLALIEDMVLGILAKIGDAPAGPADRDPKQVDAFILAKMPDRSEKAQAPPQATPTARWTPAATLEHFRESRARTATIARSTTDLRGHVIPHPAFGPLDGYEWVLAVAAHSERHTKQILEVKADPGFPKN